MTRVNLWWLPALAILAGSLGTEHGNGGGNAPLIEALVFGGLAGLSLVAASVWPRAAVVVCGASALGYFATGLANGPIFLALPLTTLVAAQRVRNAKLIPVLLPAGALVVLGLALRSALHPVPWTEDFWECVAVLAMTTGAALAGWSIGDRARARSERARLVATEERLQMARELHDGVGHGLAVIAMHAGVALHLTDRRDDPDPEVRRLLEGIRDASRESLDLLRTELGRLAPGEELAERTPTHGLDDVAVLVDRVRAGGLAIDVHRELGPDAVSDEVAATAYAIIQESLTNVLRHAGAARVELRIAREHDRLVVVIRDDGRSGDGPVREGMGLAGMRARAERLGGTLSAGPGEHGFVVRAELPLAPR